MGIKSWVFRKSFGYVFAAIFGIPFITSGASYLWHMTKFNVQQIDCISDTSNAITRWSLENDSMRLRQGLGQINSDFRTCVNKIDINKSSASFIEEQYKRTKESN